MIGPVLYQELLLAGRRSQQYIFRWIYAAWLILQIVFFSYFWLFAPGGTATGDLAAWFVELFLVQQLILMVLVTPAFAAGSVTEEKANGTLQYLLTSDLSPLHIVGGKLVARTFQVAVLALTGLPLFCFLCVYAGAEPITLVAVIGVTLAPLVALVAASLLASVWSTQTRNAALGLYALFIAGLLAVAWLGDVLRVLNPLYVLEPAWGARDLATIRVVLGRLLGALAAWGGIAGVCAVVATWQLRPAYRRQLEGEGKKKKARWWRAQRAPIGDEPIAWKERHLEGLAPAVFLRRLPRWLGVLAVFAAATASSTLILWMNLVPGATLVNLFISAARLDAERMTALLRPASEDFRVQGILVMLLASLLVGIRCSGAVSGERERKTWEALLLTPLTTKQLIRAKLWGIMGASYIFVLACAVPALALSGVASLPDLVRTGFPASVFWTAIWLAVTVLAMYCIGAAGIWCSVRCKTSWRSLLWTVAIGYVGGFVIFCVIAGPLAIVAYLVFLLVMVTVQYFQIPVDANWALWVDIFYVTACLGLALVAWLMSLFLLSSAQKYIAYRERTLQWQEDEPRRPRRFRRPIRRAVR